MNKNYSSLELFAGAGGLALGISQAGFKHLACIERNGDCCATLEYNQLAPTILSDVSTINFSSFQGELTLLSGGPPCQPFSMGGKARAFNDERNMFPQALRAIMETRPKLFILENVPGLCRATLAPYFAYLLKALRYSTLPLSLRASDKITYLEHEQLLTSYLQEHPETQESYQIHYKLLNAADYGVAQSRKRLIIVGIRADLKLNWDFPSPSHSKESLLYSQWISHDYWKKHQLPIPKPSHCPYTLSQLERIERQHLAHPLFPWQTTRDALLSLPAPRHHNLKASSPSLKVRADGIGSATLDNHILRPGAKAYAGHSGSALDLPAKTIKAGTHGVPGGENMICLDDGSVRYFTVRECARLQGFPDDYHFIGSWSSCVRQIGNAVPVPLAKTIALSLITALTAQELWSQSCALSAQWRGQAHQWPWRAAVRFAGSRDEKTT